MNNNINDSNNNIIQETNNEFTTNCLSLTVRKDYRLTVFSNTISTFKRMFFKVFFNYGLLNFLSMIL